MNTEKRYTYKEVAEKTGAPLTMLRAMLKGKIFRSSTDKYISESDFNNLAEKLHTRSEYDAASNQIHFASKGSTPIEFR